MSEKREREDEEEKPLEQTKKLKWEVVDYNTYGVFPKAKGYENLEAVYKLLKLFPCDITLTCADGTFKTNKYLWDLLFFKKDGFAEPKYELPFKKLSIRQFFFDHFAQMAEDEEKIDLLDYANAWQYLNGEIYSLKYICTAWFNANAKKSSSEQYALFCSSKVDMLRQYFIRQLFASGFYSKTFQLEVYALMEDSEYKDELYFCSVYFRQS